MTTPKKPSLCRICSRRWDEASEKKRAEVLTVSKSTLGKQDALRGRCSVCGDHLEPAQ